MGKKNKHLCQWKKDERKQDLEGYRAIVKKPKLLCEDCGRVAVKKKWLCKPMSLGKDA